MHTATSMLAALTVLLDRAQARDLTFSVEPWKGEGKGDALDCLGISDNIRDAAYAQPGDPEYAELFQVIGGHEALLGYILIVWENSTGGHSVIYS